MPLGNALEQYRVRGLNGHIQAADHIAENALLGALKEHRQDALAVDAECWAWVLWAWVLLEIGLGGGLMGDLLRDEQGLEDGGLGPGPAAAEGHEEYV
jgi:hypothetical protein